MSYYPVFLQLEGTTALVVGGGGVAQRKVETLLAFGASISIVSKALTPQLKKWVDEGTVRFLGEEMADAFFDGVFLVIVATDDAEFNHRVSQGARTRGILVNAVDQPADCTFIVPSIVKRGDLMVAISTSGKSPAFAKEIRKGLEAQFGDEYADFLSLMGALRKTLLNLGRSQAENSRIFHAIVESDILHALAQKDRRAVAGILREILPPDMDMETLLDKVLW